MTVFSICTVRRTFSVLTFLVAFTAALAVVAEDAPKPKEECKCTPMSISVRQAATNVMASRATTDVSVTSNMYKNSSVTITAGDTVTWTNNGGFHTVTDDNGAYDSGGFGQGSTFSHTFSSAGTFPYHCSFHGGVGGVGMSGTVVVNAAQQNVAAAINSPLNVNATAGVPFSYTLTATGNPAPTVSFTNLPAELSVNGATISGTFASAGQATVSLHATNTAGSDDQTLTISINSIPAITSALSDTAIVGTNYSYTLTASGSPAPNLFFSSVGGGLAVNGSTVSGTFNSPGQVSVGLHASNVAGSDFQTLVITVVAVPHITSPVTATAVVGSNFSYTLAASGSPMPALSFGGLPSGIQQNGATISGVFNAPGNFAVSLQATNSSGSDMQTLVITAGTLPVITSSLTDATTANISYTYTLTASGSPTPTVSFTGLPQSFQVNGNSFTGKFPNQGQVSIGVHATNAIGTTDQTLVVMVNPLGDGAFITSPLTAAVLVGGNFSYTLTAIGNPAPAISYATVPPGFQVNGATMTGMVNSAGQISIGLHAANNSGVDDETLILTVGTAPVITSVLEVRALLGANFTYTLTATGSPAPTLTFGALPQGISMNNGTLSGTFNSSGQFSIGVHASNVFSSDNQTLLIDAGGFPSITSALKASSVIGSTFSYTLTATGAPDPTVDFTSIPAGFTVNGSTITGTFSQAGTTTIGLSATNSIGTDTKALVVMSGTLPTISSPQTVSTSVGAAFSFTITGSGVPAPTFSFPAPPSGFTVKGATITGTFAKSGNVIVPLRATNAIGTADQLLFVTVGSAPAITSALTANAVVGADFLYTIVATGVPAASYSISNSPASLTLNGATIKGQFTSPGTVTLALTATNSYGSDTKNLVVTVAGNTEGIGGDWTGQIRGKIYSDTTGVANSGTLTQPITVTFSQSGNDLFATIVASTATYTLKGRIGSGNLWMAGTDTTTQQTITVSGHIAKTGKSIKGEGLIVSSAGAQEFSITLARKK